MKTKAKLLLIVEKEPPAAKAGIPSLSAKVTTILTDREGPLDSALQQFAAERPSTVQYERVEVSRQDQRKLAELGVVWLPQVRLIKGTRVVLRSSVKMADTGEYLLSDVGGQSFRRRNQNYLIEQLAEELETTNGNKSN